MPHEANSYRTQCDQCFTHTKVDAALIGKRIKCRSCGHVFVVEPPPPELKKFKDSPILTQPKPIPTPANDGSAPQQTTAVGAPDLRNNHRPGQYTPERREKLPNYALAEEITRRIATGASLALFFGIGSCFALLQDDKYVRSYRDENGRRVKVYEADGKPNATLGEAILGALFLGACGFVLGCLFGGGKSSRR